MFCIVYASVQASPTCIEWYNTYMILVIPPPSKVDYMYQMLALITLDLGEAA